MRVVVKPIIKPINAPTTNYREFDEVGSVDDDMYPIIKIRHRDCDRYVLMRVPDDCYIIIQDDEQSVNRQSECPDRTIPKGAIDG